MNEKVDVCVIGAGHAGCEAALACARLGMKTVIFTVSVDSIALMPCNPNIGGTSKGHLVREIDALGGEMGKNIDKTFIQSKMLNISKGPAVHSLRAQADKADYSRSMRQVLENQENLTIKQGEVVEILVEAISFTDDKIIKNEVINNKIINSNMANYEAVSKTLIENEKEINSEILNKEEIAKDNSNIDSFYNIAESSAGRNLKIIGVKTFTGTVYECRAVILCTGTYLNARCLCGEAITYTGPNGLQSANHLTASLANLGIALRRFKTGTPARMDKRSLDFSKMEEQPGDERIIPFSFSTDPAAIQKEQVSCYLTYTNEATHEIIRNNLDRSPMYAGVIEGTGARYCPSIEDKVVKFADKARHQVFLEPEGLHTNEMYVSGMSSSLPEDVQTAMYRTVPGMENCQIVRNAYAIEYDCIDPSQLYPTLRFKEITGFYSAGQINGSSGYEEAAAQGLIAGINAALFLQGKEEIIIDRSEAYIGVLIDDLVTKETTEPYRMMTSRAEYRLLLRQDNADLRIREKGYFSGLIDQVEYQRLLNKKQSIQAEIERLKNTKLGASGYVREFLAGYDSPALKTATSLAELLCRPELNYEKLAPLDPERPVLAAAVTEQVEIEIKYEGYIIRQQRQVMQFKKMEKKKIPESISYDDVPSLRIEARQKLKAYRPVSVGQASRISGVSPADISVLLVYLEQYR